MQQPLQSGDATICSNDSAYGTPSLVNSPAKQEGKIKAYVDFKAFDKNYSEYVKKNEDQNRVFNDANELKGGSNDPVKTSDDWTSSMTYTSTNAS